jgi:hypothetical protein
MEKRYYSEADGSLAGQHIECCLWNSEIRYRVHNNQSKE